MAEKGIKDGDDLVNLKMFQERKGRISNNINMANKLPIEEYKNTTEKNTRKPKKLKSKPSMKKWKVITAIALIGATAATASIAIAKNEHKVEENTVGYTEKQNNENESNIILENQITTVEGVEKDFVDKYLKAYNEKYNTDYDSAKMIVTSLNEGVVYETPSGDHVTRGNNPTETEKVLKDNNGGYRIVEGYNKVYQIVDDNNKVLGTYNLATGEFIYSGNQLSDLKNNKFKKPELEELGINPNKAEKAAEVLASAKSESSDSINKRIQQYQITSDTLERENDGIER